MSAEFLQEGLDAYARGEYLTAARAWTKARVANPNDKVIAQYLQHLRSQDPLSVNTAEGELSAEAAPAPPSAPTMAPIPVPAPAPAVAAAEPPAPAKDPWGEHAILGPPAVVSSEAPGLSFVAKTTQVPSAAVSALDAMLARLRDVAELDDFSGTLKLADEILGLDPANAEARQARDHSRSVLTQMHISELGTLDAIPVVSVPADQVIWLDLDQRAGFVLAQIDGRSSYNDIVSVTGMDELETLGILSRLAREKIIAGR